MSGFKKQLYLSVLIILNICFLTACTAISVKTVTLPKTTKVVTKATNIESNDVSSSLKQLNPSLATKVARITGSNREDKNVPSPNKTDANYEVQGTDLGILWDDGENKIMAAFGDTFGQGWHGPGGNGNDWRSNVLGLSTDTNLSDGLTLSTMIMDLDKHAKEIISSNHDTSGTGEFTAIPTAGISVGSRNFIHYMDIKSWDSPGFWTTNFSEIAYSDDLGKNWIKSGVKWAAQSNFAQAAYIKDNGYVYMFGTTAGRHGSIYIARVPEKEILSLASYRYWNGDEWIKDEVAAKAVVTGPVGELSVQYNSYFKRWIMCYLNETKGAIVMRDAKSIIGSWGDEKILVKNISYPGLYGAFIHPWTNKGRDLYFTMSQWDLYNVFLMHSTLSLK